MKKEDKCCAVFDPSPYDDKAIEWKDKLFVKDSMRTFLHMPLFNAFGKTVTRLMGKVDAVEACPEDKDLVMLSRDPSPFKSELYISVTKEVPGTENLKLSGKYLTRVYDGPYSDMRKWITDLKNYTESKGKVLNDMYFYYTTCPKCAKKHGNNYVVGFAKIN